MDTEIQREPQSAPQISPLTGTILPKVTRIHWLAIGVGAIVAAFIAFLLFNRLSVYPAPTFDEGAFLKVAKNFAQHGIYADFSLGEERYTGAIVSTGPTLILPIALLFRIFGASIVLGRLVVSCFDILLLIVLYSIGRKLQDWRLGLCAALLVILLPGVSFDFIGRSVFGELPGLFFLFTGFALWMRPTPIRTGRRDWGRWIAVGVLFGCSAITKNQYAPIILGGIGLSWLADLLWYRQRGGLYFIVPGLITGLIYAGWTYYVLFLIGSGTRDVSADLHFLRSTTTNSIILFNSAINNSNLTQLIQDNFLLFPALLYGLVSALRKDEQEQKWGILTFFLLIAVVMFIFSNGWARYEAASQVLSVLLIARLGYRLTNGFEIHGQDLTAVLRGKELSRTAIGFLLMAALLISLVARPVYLELKDVTLGGSDAPYQVERYLNDNVPTSAVIATYESNLGVLTDHAYIFAPYSVVVNLTVNNVVGKQLDPSYYSFLFTPRAQYVVIGPFANALGYYTPDRFRQGYDMVFKAGDYTVYRRNGEQSF